MHLTNYAINKDKPGGGAKHPPGLNPDHHHHSSPALGRRRSSTGGGAGAAAPAATADGAPPPPVADAPDCKRRVSWFKGWLRERGYDPDALWDEVRRKMFILPYFLKRSGTRLA